MAQQRYQPSTPTVSPYLNLFQNNRNSKFSRALPNYYSLVRPQLQQQQVNQTQQTLIQQQDNTIKQLQENVQIIQQQPGQVVTGHGGRFMNTSRYFAEAGTGQQAFQTQGQRYSPSGGASRGPRR
jgi:hypothetical protein